ncbi:MAG: single-stranded DNA-binding protein [Methanobrevibacter sp.]|nr:single-stranded DNA-binding protein [Methanobrevibacter sp.]
MIGRLGQDVELRYASGENQKAVCRFSIAVKNPYKGGEVDWVNCVSFGKIAETLSKYTKKGSAIAIMGRIHTGNYKNKDGKTVYTFDVIVQEFDFIDKKNDSQKSQDNLLYRSGCEDYLPF